MGSRPRTRVEAASKGHRAYQQHRLALRAITEGILDEATRTHCAAWALRSEWVMSARGAQPAQRAIGHRFAEGQDVGMDAGEVTRRIQHFPRIGQFLHSAESGIVMLSPL